MSEHTVKQVARMSGVSVRTLHHYDEIGLLKPARVGENGYRWYGREELLRLQQILLHRELEMPLEAIGRLLDAAGFDRAAALKVQRAALAAKAERYDRLLRTLDETIASIEGATDMDDKNLYMGFAPEKQAEYEVWVADRYEGAAAMIDGSRVKMSQWGKADYASLKAEVESIEAAMAQTLRDGLPVDSAAVTALMARHHAMIARTWPKPPTREAFIGLGRMYAEHPDFTARYEALAPGLTEYMGAAMAVYAEARL
ncbi:MerR family transcriptional regulator [Caulobacter segnis]|uniref:MerR family transcriptional regulator n=1 Tax=Caulobacter segnis TaxID=88688 RepID=UPI00240EBB89|nr:MerR family transcriptional regulator [Caulobacter segnis]MDG2520103.1 MerR family transcriptional regulator [Caulobacter segnis]